MSEELEDIKNNLYSDDFSDGLHNIEVPPEMLQELKEQDSHVNELIVIQDEMCNSAYKTDGVRCVFSPEELIVLKEILEVYTVRGRPYINYLDCDEISPYDQVGILRELRDKIDGNVNEYVKMRPYSPWFMNWVKRIGKENVRKENDNKM